MIEKFENHFKKNCTEIREDERRKMDVILKEKERHNKYKCIMALNQLKTLKVGTVAYVNKKRAINLLNKNWMIK